MSELDFSSHDEFLSDSASSVNEDTLELLHAENSTTDEFAEEELGKVECDLQKVKERIESTIVNLSTLKYSKAISQLIRDIALLYSYTEDLVSYFLDLFTPAEAIQFFEANERQRPLTIRTNTLKTTRRILAQQLIQRGMTLEPTGEWTKLSLTVTESSVPVGATPEYLTGKYMIQSASSLVPVIALDPRPNESVLDMAAAPGGKTTHIGQVMKNEGVIFANDLKYERVKSLVSNLSRLGITNAVVISMDGRELKKVLPKVNRVLLDAPCSGSGIISRDSSVKVKRGKEDFVENMKLQRELILAAFDIIDIESAEPVLVYSTCSISIEENEMVVEYLLQNREAKIVPFDEIVPFGAQGFTSFKGNQFHPSMKHSKRFYPHVHNMDGFFVCKILKISANKKRTIRKDRRSDTEVQVTWGDNELTSTRLMSEVLDFDEVDISKKKLKY
jgi:25S rRNA (cytosine2870-C5)-methyltransferase